MSCLAERGRYVLLLQAPGAIWMLGLISEAQLSGGIRVVPDWQYGAETQAGLVPASLPAGPVIRSLVLEVIFKDSQPHSSVTIPANTGCPDALPLTLWPALCFPFPGAEPMATQQFLDCLLTCR